MLPQVRSRSQVPSGNSTPASIPIPFPSVLFVVSSIMSKFDAMFPRVGSPCSDKDIDKSMATLPKSNRGTGKELTKNLSIATASLEFKFGVMSELTICNSSGKVKDRNFASNKIADIFCNNGRIMRCLVDCVKQFDMLDVTTIPSLLNKTATTNSGKCGGQTIDMLDNVKTLCLEDIQEYTSDILKFDKTDGT